jgi:hypothetical protein
MRCPIIEIGIIGFFIGAGKLIPVFILQIFVGAGASENGENKEYK